MKVRELIEWLKAFEDQDADVFVVEHESGRGYYDQGGNACENKRSLLLGAMNV